tara:strand:+ start:2667 stop:3164 length:498 start_codon:yes stop_codon:yes gene_type:complete
MEYGLTTYQENLMTLNRLINEPFICKYILKIKDKEEKEDNYQYHSELWSLLMGAYYHSREYSPFTGLINHYSYVLNNDTYIYEVDRVKDFFYLTGISFQSREILLDTLSNEYIVRNHFGFQEEEFGKDRKEKDLLYRQLSINIMNEMKKLKRKKMNYYMVKYEGE